MMKCLADVLREYNDAAKNRLEAQQSVYHPAIVVSRQAGSGGGRIAMALAERLNFQLWDRKILEELVSKGHITTNMAEQLDERDPGFIQKIGFQLLSVPSSVEVIDSHLKRSIHALLEAGSVVIVGRGAACVVRPTQALRIRIVAPLEKRVANWMRENDKGSEATRSELQTIETNRAAFLKRVFDKSEATLDYFDVVLNTGELSVENCVDLAIAAYHMKFKEAVQPHSHSMPPMKQHESSKSRMNLTCM